MRAMLTLYDALGSGNGYKVRLLLRQLGRPFERVLLDIVDKRETRQADFLAMNPNGRIPTLVFEDGRILAVALRLSDLFAVGPAEGIPIQLKAGETRECLVDGVPDFVECCLPVLSLAGGLCPEKAVHLPHMGKFGFDHDLPFGPILDQGIGNRVVEGNDLRGDTVPFDVLHDSQSGRRVAVRAQGGAGREQEGHKE